MGLFSKEIPGDWWAAHRSRVPAVVRYSSSRNTHAAPPTTTTRSTAP